MARKPKPVPGPYIPPIEYALPEIGREETAIVSAWYRLRKAIDCVLTRQPSRMTEAALELEDARNEFDAVVNSSIFGILDRTRGG